MLRAFGGDFGTAAVLNARVVVITHAAMLVPPIRCEGICRESSFHFFHVDALYLGSSTATGVDCWGSTTIVPGGAVAYSQTGSRCGIVGQLESHAHWWRLC